MGELPTPVASAGPETTGVFFPRSDTVITLLIFALAEPLPVPDEQPLPFEQPELLPAESDAVAEDRVVRFATGMSVSAGAWKWGTEWVAAASLALDLHALLGPIELVFSPHVTVHVNDETAGLFGFEGQLVVPLGEHLAVSVGSEQLLSVSRWQTGAFRFGPTLRPFIARAGRHRFSVQLTWLAVGANERVYRSCAECSQRPMPYYTLGYGVLF